MCVPIRLEPHSDGATDPSTTDQIMIITIYIHRTPTTISTSHLTGTNLLIIIIIVVRGGGGVYNLRVELVPINNSSTPQFLLAIPC